MNKALLGFVRKQIEDFQQKNITITPGYVFNQFSTINKIELYYNSKFETGDIDSEGFKKFFYNVVHFPCDVASKATDLDTKDFRWVPTSSESEVPTMFLSREIKNWMKETDFGEVLNQVNHNLPIYGSVVVKKVKDELEVVDLHNLVNDPSVEELDEGLVIEKHQMTPYELREMPWDKKAVENIINQYQADPQNTKIQVYEVWGYIPDTYVDGKNSNKSKCRFAIVAGVEKFTQNKSTKEVIELGEVLDVKDVSEDDFPYYEFHWEKIPGRWMGVGLVERNFDAQVGENENENLMRKAMYWTSKILFQTQDKLVTKNLMTDAVNGDIIRTESGGISELNIRSTDPTAFSNSTAKWRQNVQESSFSFEAESGQNLPSGTPFRLGALLKAGSGGYFNLKREDIGLVYQRLFFDCIIPSFKKSKRAKHLLSIPRSDKDRQALIEKYAEVLVFARVQARTSNGEIPTMEEVNQDRQMVLQTLSQRENLFIEIPQSFYDNAKFYMDLIITDEQIDLGQKLETLANVIQMIGSNPMLLQNPQMKSLMFAALSLSGISPSEFGLDKVEPQPLPGQMPGEAQPMGSPPKLSIGQSIPRVTPNANVQ